MGFSAQQAEKLSAHDRQENSDSGRGIYKEILSLGWNTPFTC